MNLDDPETLRKLYGGPLTAHCHKDRLMRECTYLVFGDLHGRILPAFRLASAWSREHETRLDGLLQVGDLGFFPDPTRLDKATKRHAEKDPSELGAGLVAEPSAIADEVFADPHCPDRLYFIAGNHEDFERLESLGAGGDGSVYPVDAYLRVWCIRDGHIRTLPGGLRVAGLWGIDAKGPRARRGYASRAYIRSRSATQLSGESFDVLLTHDSARDAIYPGSGSEEISALVDLARPAFHFFGHYSGAHGLVDCRPTRSQHMAGLELRGPGGTVEENSVGLLRHDGEALTFDYLPPSWLRTFTRHTWRHR